MERFRITLTAKDNRQFLPPDRIFVSLTVRLTVHYIFREQ